jgi:hypothetical protein
MVDGVAAEFELYFPVSCPASSRRPALPPAGRGISRPRSRCSTGDPSLRLKSGFARDAAIEEAKTQTWPPLIDDCLIENPAARTVWFSINNQLFLIERSQGRRSSVAGDDRGLDLTTAVQHVAQNLL